MIWARRRKVGGRAPILGCGTNISANAEPNRRGSFYLSTLADEWGGLDEAIIGVVKVLDPALLRGYTTH